MPAALRTGLVLGLAVVAWTFVMGVTGWYRHPTLLNLFWLVIPVQAGVMVWGLRTTAPASGYARQVGLGLLACLVASVLIFGGSCLFTAVVYPGYFKELEALGRAQMAQSGLRPEQIEAAIKLQAPFQTPLANALMGVVGTLSTGLVISLVAAAWLRKR